MSRTSVFSIVAIQTLVFVSSAIALPIDGVLDPEYGAPLSIQTTQTSLGEESTNPYYGSELDGGFGFVADDTLYLLLTGNFNRFFSEPLTFPNQLHVFIDTGSGGQNPLSSSNPDGSFLFGRLLGMTGLAFDIGFAPDYWLSGSREASGPDPMFVYYAELPAGGGGDGYWLGRADIGGPGTISVSGGNNPYGILASIDISNTAGVTVGCAAASGDGVTTGVEWALPLAALGNPSGPIRVCALLVSYFGSSVSNQVLGPVPPGSCALGSPGSVDFANIPGVQYFVIDAPTSAVHTTWGRIKARYR